MSIKRSINLTIIMLLLVAASGAHAQDVLILSSNPTATVTSVDNQIITTPKGTTVTTTVGTVSGLGMTSKIVDPTQWKSENYSNYKAILIHINGANWGGFSPIAAAEANANIWASAASGNVVIIGTDPSYSGTKPHSGGAQLLQSAIKFAASGKKTGAVIVLEGKYSGVSAGTPVPVLAGFESTSTGKFSVEGTDKNKISIVASHPALASLTGKVLSDWHNSSHNGFNSWPTDFTPLAIVTDVPALMQTYNGVDIDTKDPVSGFPYILARGVTPGTAVPDIGCCFPIQMQEFRNMLSFTQHKAKQKFNVKFKTTAVFDAKVQAYFNYVSLVDPAIQNMDLFLFLYDCGKGMTVPSKTPCPGGVLMDNIKVLSWNSSTTGAPIAGEIAPPYTPGTYLLLNGLNAFDQKKIFDQKVEPNHLYQVVAVPAFDRPSFGDMNRIEFLDEKCGVFLHQFNDMQSNARLAAPSQQRNPGPQEVTTETTRLGKEDLEESAAGRALQKQLVPLSGVGEQQQTRSDAGASQSSQITEEETSGEDKPLTVQFYKPGEAAPNDNDSAEMNAEQMQHIFDRRTDGLQSNE